MDGAFLGEIEPVGGGRWVWPFREIEAGQWFLVDKLLRDTETLRRMVHVRGSQLNKSFSVTQPEEHPGFTKVECVDRAAVSVQPLGFVEYRDAIGVIRRHYGADASHLMWTGMSIGHQDEMIVPRISEPRASRLIVVIQTGYTFTTGVELLEDRVRITALAESTTLSEWQALDLLGE